MRPPPITTVIEIFMCGARWSTKLCTTTLKVIHSVRSVLTFVDIGAEILWRGVGPRRRCRRGRGFFHELRRRWRRRSPHDFLIRTAVHVTGVKLSDKRYYVVTNKKVSGNLPEWRGSVRALPELSMLRRALVTNERDIICICRFGSSRLRGFGMIAYYREIDSFGFIFCVINCSKIEAKWIRYCLTLN